ncbi:MAG: sodium:solute symporter family protein [Bacillota bacterium]
MERWVSALIMMGAYLTLALVIGILAGRKRDFFSLAEFATAHRDLALFIMWFMMGGTIFSAFAFLGGPGWAFSRGAASYYVLGYCALGLLPWYVIGPKVSRIGGKHGLTCMGDFAEARYGSKALTGLIGLIATFAFIQYLCLQIKGAAYIFNVLTEGNISYNLAALLTYGIVIIYVSTGGLRAAAWSDVLQSGLMIVVAWSVGFTLVNRLHGGVGAMFQKIAAESPGFLQIGAEGSKMSANAYSTAILVSVLGFVMWPHLFAKSFVTTPRKIKQTVLAYPLFALIMVPVLFMGFAAIGHVQPSAITSSDQIVPYVITHNLGATGWLYGLVGAGALAAAMSSADAITHGAAVEFVQGIYKLFRPNAKEREIVTAMRWSVVGIGAIALYIALFGAAGLIQLLLGAYGSIVQFAPLIYGALYWKRSSKAGAIAGLIAGVGVNTYYQVIVGSSPLDINPGIWGLVVNLVIFVAVSLLTKPSDQGIAEEFISA